MKSLLFLINVLLMSSIVAPCAADPSGDSIPAAPAEPKSKTEASVPAGLAPFTPAVDLKGGWGFVADQKLPNVLIIGDSISIGYTRLVREKLIGLSANEWKGSRQLRRHHHRHGEDRCLAR